MVASYAYCPGCEVERMQGGEAGNAFIVANEAQLKLVQEGHSRWAGADNAPFHQFLEIAGVIPEHLAGVIKFGIIPMSSIELGRNE